MKISKAQKLKLQVSDRISRAIRDLEPWGQSKGSTLKLPLLQASRQPSRLSSLIEAEENLPVHLRHLILKQQAPNSMSVQHYGSDMQSDYTHLFLNHRNRLHALLHLQRMIKTRELGSNQGVIVILRSAYSSVYQMHSSQNKK